MLYGHVESNTDKVKHLMLLRELQDEAPGFQCFIPLAFHPDHTKLSHIRKPDGFTDLKTLAISRLMLDNIPHIKAYWIMLGLKIAQVAQHFGANDIDGTVVEEKIYHMAGADTPQEVPASHLKQLIAETGREAVERNTLYEPIRQEMFQTA
jgi:aminodeoxyfutalosine synthase